MATRASRPQRRNQVLSREQIIGSAVELLDAGGESALTVRALTERLATGSGAIYYQVGAREELLDAATESVVLAVLATEASRTAVAPPEELIRGVALALFDAIAEHPWLAARLTLQIVRNPAGPVTTGIFERIGRQVGALGVPRTSWFEGTSTLVHYILGAVSQNARLDDPTDGPTDADREEFLDSASTAWRGLDPEDFPFVHAIAEQVREHDDRRQFLAGIEIVLDGLRHRR